MLLSGVGLGRIGLIRPCLQVQSLNRAQLSSDSCRGLQTLAQKPRLGQRVWRLAYEKRAFQTGIITGIGLGLSAFMRPNVHCEGPTEEEGRMNTEDYPPPPRSSLSVFELSFGAVTGLCAGVFVKKGARAVAWLLGGIFVLLQYMGSKSLIKVDWANISTRFENLFYTHDATGSVKPPNVMSLWGWLIDFLTANFQPRASFIAGFALGLRIG